MLTNATVKAAEARLRAYNLGDERGLHLFVTLAGGSTFSACIIPRWIPGVGRGQSRCRW